MFQVLWNLMAVVGIFTTLLVIFVVLSYMMAPYDNSKAEGEQGGYLKHYFNRKDDNND